MAKSSAKSHGARGPLLLAVDISNTGIKFGLYPREGSADERDTLVARWRIATVREKTTDEYAVLLASLCQQAGINLAQIGDVIVSSVVPQLTPVFSELATKHHGREALVVTHEMDLGIRLLVDNPWETGADRIISALAAHAFYGGPAIVIQFGTATTFDCVSSERRLPWWRHRAGAGNLGGGADARSLAALPGGAGSAAVGAGQKHDERDAVGDRLRARRAGGGAGGATARGATDGGTGASDRARWPRGRHGSRDARHRNRGSEPAAARPARGLRPSASEGCVKPTYMGIHGEDSHMKGIASIRRGVLRTPSSLRLQCDLRSHKGQQNGQAGKSPTCRNAISTKTSGAPGRNRTRTAGSEDRCSIR